MMRRQVGKWISVVVPVRWAFEAVGHDLGVRDLLLSGASPLGPPLVAAYGDAALDPTGRYWAYLVVFTLGFFTAAWFVLRRRIGRPIR